MSPADHLQDAEPAAWQGDNKPDPTEDDHRLGMAARRFAVAAEAVEQHQGPRAGPEYTAKLTMWRARYAELREAAQAHPGDAS